MNDRRSRGRAWSTRPLSNIERCALQGTRAAGCAILESCKLKGDTPLATIGADIPRVDGCRKLLGTARYVDDLPIPGVLHGGTVRSPAARGRIRAIHFDPTIDWDEFVIIDHRDIPGRNEVLFITADHPALVANEIRFKGEPVVLLAHRSISELRRGLRGVTVEVEELAPRLTPFAPLPADQVQHGEDNVFKRIDIIKGEPDIVFPHAAHVIEGTYYTGSQEHVYLETQGMIAEPADGRMVIRGTLQCPYYVLNSLTHFFGRPDEAFQVIQTPTGGGFGGKEDFPSILAIHAALLAEKSGRPVKMIYDRMEDMAYTTKRHPSRVRHRTAVDRNGKLLAMSIEVVLDGGAYVTLSPVVLSRGVIHAAGPYHCEHVRIHGEVVLTNTPPNGAFRGFGAPQTFFALERHMDVVARTLGLDPAAVRRANLLKQGQTTATTQVIDEPIDLAGLQDRALQLACYPARLTEYAEFNATHPYLRRGIGLATFHHGAGFTGSGETYLASEVWVEGLEDGRIEVLTANTDMGQGTETILSQVAADAMGIAVDQIVLNRPDTARVPNSGPTVASRTAMVVGKLLEQACDEVTTLIGGYGQDVGSAIRAWHAAHPGQRLLGKARYKKPDHILWDEDNYRGDAYATFSWSTHVAAVEVDLRTCGVRMTDYVAAQEIGRVVNPVLATGQIQGGVVQGIGWALTEEVIMRDGVMANNQMTNYIIPASGDLPPIRVLFEQHGGEFGPRGAKGIGELPMDGPAPAVVNAVCHALGVSIAEIPLTPERLLSVVEGRGGE